MSMRERIADELTGIARSPEKVADRILAIVREGLPVRKKLDCGLSPHEIYKLALTDVIAKLEEKG